MFYIFGSMGVIWFALWFRKAASGPVNDPRVSDKEREYIVANTCEQVRALIKRLPRLRNLGLLSRDSDTPCTERSAVHHASPDSCPAVPDVAEVREPSTLTVASP